MIITLLDRHIGRTIMYSTGLVFAVLIALFSLFEFIDKLDELGKAGTGLYDVLRYLVLTMPRKTYELFPMAALLGTTMGLSSLAVDSELIAMRAAGVSLLRIVKSVVKVGGVFVLVAVLVGELLAPVAESAAQRGRAESKRVGILQDNLGIWLRDELAFINIGEVLPDLSVLKINIYDFDAENRLRTQTYAEAGRYEAGVWHLRGVSQSTVSENKVIISRRAEQEWESAIEPETLSVFAVKPESLSALSLFRYIRHLKRNNQETSRYRLAFWYKLASPVTTGVMVVLAVPFVFMSLRSTGMGFRLFMGIMLGLGFYVVSRGFGYASLLFGISPIVGAILPSLLFLLLAMGLLRRVA